MKRMFSLGKGSQGCDITPARWAFRGLLAATVVVFVLFFTVGYAHLYAYDPSFRDPMLTPALLGFVAFVVVMALAVAAWAVVASARRRGKHRRVVNGIQAGRIATTVAASTALVMALSFATASTQPVAVNGGTFDHALMLRTVGMFVASSAVMLLAAMATVAYGAWRTWRVNTSTDSPTTNEEK